ncbi:MAG: hypothetical protein AABZ06_11625 [Bdellovibrionota bacterium]
MRLQKLLIVGALLTGLLLAPTKNVSCDEFARADIFSKPSHISIDISSAEKLARQMRHSGIRKLINRLNRPDLEGILTSANEYTKKIDLGCKIALFHEVRFRDELEEFEMIVGYEVCIECDDAPHPAISLYYDVNHRYLAALDLAD